MKKILLATSNAGKVKEFKKLIQNESVFKNAEILTLADMDEKISPEEPYNTFYENAYHKAENYSAFYGMPVIAEDSGLVVPSLEGEPGVFSARYAGENSSDEENFRFLLEKLGDSSRRSAYYESTVIYYENPKMLVSATGRCHGEITRVPRGSGGFGYDPVFLVPELGKTMAEISLEEKNKISHRRLAMEKLIKKIVQKGFL
jgi:XTP/dITP diphosphohydrolase